MASNLKEMVLLARELGADLRPCLSLDVSLVVKDASKAFDIEAAGHLESHNDRLAPKDGELEPLRVFGQIAVPSLT